MSESKMFELQVGFISEQTLKIAECNKFIARNMTKISSLKQSSEVLGRKYCDFQIEKCKESLKQLNADLIVLKDELDDLQYVSSDFFMSKLDEVKHQTDTFYNTQKLKLEKKTKKQKGAVVCVASKTVPKGAQSDEKKAEGGDDAKLESTKVEKPKKKRKFKQQPVVDEFVRDFALEKYWETSDSLPSWVKDSLDKIPHNYGFIWKHSWFFGALDPIPNKPQIMFEIKKSGKFMVYEYWRTNCREVTSRMCKHPNQYIEEYINPSYKRQNNYSSHRKNDDLHHNNVQHGPNRKKDAPNHANRKKEAPNHATKKKDAATHATKKKEDSSHQRRDNGRKNQPRDNKPMDDDGFLPYVPKAKKKKPQVSADGWTTVG